MTGSAILAIIAIATFACAAGIGIAVGDPDEKKPVLKRRLVRNIDPDDANEVIQDLENDGFKILGVTPFLSAVDSVLTTSYDILVEGEGTPNWGAWGEDLG